MSIFLSEANQNIVVYKAGEQLGEGYLKLNANESPYPPSPKMLEKLNSETINNLRFYGDITYHDIREKVASKFDLTAENISIGNGADDVLDLICRTFFKAGDALIFPNITYPFYQTYAKSMNYDYREVPVDEQLRIDLNDYLNSDAHCIITNPNAPSGHYHPLEKIEAVVKSNPNRLVIVDEAYIDFGGTSVAPLVSEYQNLIVVQTFSKSRNLASGRFGFAIASAELIEDMNNIRGAVNPFFMSGLQIAMAEASLDDEKYFKAAKTKIIETRDDFIRQLRVSDFTVLDSTTNFALVKPRNKTAKDIYQALKARKILVRYYNKPIINQYLRISIGRKEDMAAVTQALLEIDTLAYAK
ncbi:MULTISPECIES: histidinol-phosphate transaminase [unclassified Enterococcus]|uniref:pyridoxal phosphate-dependent aminotransferase n=1 Tax=unclassified Enterococcus TaxID=2608891 RepID=UPI001554C5B4|nr:MULTISPECIES: histidinol-phosphate transaminase [unclassified Enterococcus]MBS7577138.1 histidinol-phosphate transaminase [Enterococcus sp. MMGLQ5-2]MBS7584415.1 histidinol-phosphate transaminase [Enterococcus sp. MMGLQ5-1]NPD12270.1 histidinol-phosphate transaminase [Enterococcus sp. MMGLQ5-1]NPD36972.1 histidinol-phosphate transaminase [Enterococcus sp. MMGLQ5-2]